MIAPRHASYFSMFGEQPIFAAQRMSDMQNAWPDIMGARAMMAPDKPERPDFGPNQLAWIEKHLGIKSLVRK